MRGLGPARRALDRRLSPTRRAPLAVALSGGSDSTALLRLAADWAAEQGRPLLALTVDHGLNPASAAWTERCRQLAEGLGVGFQPLSWEGPKPTSGLPAKARQARHRLLADAARRAGCAVILLGHTADDLAEAVTMRDAGSTVPSPREWSPSPVWPEGRGVFLLRPLLEVRRQDLRDWLASLGHDWIEDPANADPRFARARARQAPTADIPPPEPLRRIELAAQVRANATGELQIAREGLRTASPEDLHAFVAAACLCAAGTDAPPKRDRLERLAAALIAPGEGVFTLAGARIIAGADDVWFTREPGESARGGLPRLPLPVGESVVWDGRFEVEALRPGLAIRPLAGVASQLSPAEQSQVRALQARTRGALPAIVDGALIHCPLVQAQPPVRLRALAAERLAAACGLLEREPD